MGMRALLRKHKSRIALMIGNGVNRYGAARQTNSWHDLLVKLARTRLPARLKQVPTGVALTEFYDVLDLKSSESSAGRVLQKEFCNLLTDWRYYEQHQRIVGWAQEADAPILTTNFDHVLADAGQCTLYRTRADKFTDFYPWESYFGSRQLPSPMGGFGIWHVNGMRHYPRSVRLGLTHYMGSVHRARGWIQSSKTRGIEAGKYADEWPGSGSWLHTVFNSPLLIFGLSLEENEIFVRWLLIERARYFKRFPSLGKEAWYVYAGEKHAAGKQFFLESVGVTPLHVESYEDIYGAETWR